MASNGYTFTQRGLADLLHHQQRAHGVPVATFLQSTDGLKLVVHNDVLNNVTYLCLFGVPCVGADRVAYSKEIPSELMGTPRGRDFVVEQSGLWMAELHETLKNMALREPKIAGPLALNPRVLAELLSRDPELLPLIAAGPWPEFWKHVAGDMLKGVPMDKLTFEYGPWFEYEAQMKRHYDANARSIQNVSYISATQARSTL